ncbi:MAG: DNA polymerase III subunit beta, partial [Deltaproteobacteria bacterium]
IIRKGNTTMVMRLVDGDFPDYTRVLPVSNTKTAIINCSNFLHTLKRISILSSDKFKGIRLELQNGNMEISANNPELGEARESMEVKYEGENIAMRFNAKYFIDVLSVIEESDVELNLKDELSPAILKPLNSNEFLSVIMPMHL